MQGAPRIGLCHCHACQSRTGSAFAYIAAFHPPWRVEGEATQYDRTGDAGGSFTFRFCPVCGTNLFHTELGGRSVSVAAGAFADPSFPAPDVSVYDSRRHPWVVLPPGTVAYERDPD